MNTKDIGDIAEANIIARLLEFGWMVAKPFGDNQFYDLIVDYGEGLKRIQIKSSKYHEKRGVIISYTRRLHNTRTKSVCKAYTKDEIDFFIIYSPELKQIYLIPIEEQAGKKAAILRVTSPKGRNKNNKNMRWSEKYLINSLNWTCLTKNDR